MNRILLDLGTSVTGKTWYKIDTCNRTVDAICQKHDVPIQVAEALNARGVAFDDIDNFLRADIKTFLPDPNVLTDMEKLTNNIVDAIKTGNPIGVFGDYDVDGATSTALLYKYLSSIGVVVHFHIPDRTTEGYGPNINALENLWDKGCEIILCVDCGTTAFDVLSDAKNKGIKIAVIDHHNAEPTLPECVSIVNPNRLDDTSQLGLLCGAGVVFCVLVSLNRALKESGYLDGKTPANLLSLLDLVALGTVCDVMQLKGLNRAFVRQGLKVLAMRNNTGLRALADCSGVLDMPTAYHLGFVLGPRLNASGRIGDSNMATELLLTTDTIQAEFLAEKLNRLNKQRQELEEQALIEATYQVENSTADYGNFICVYSDKWHSGIIGIIAGRLKETYNKPTVAMSFAGTGTIGKGSGRSVDGIDLGALIVACRKEGMLISGGGHSMAVGFSIKSDKIEDFCQFIQNQIVSDLNGKKLEQPNIVDAVLNVSALNVSLCKKISMLEPFGMGNREPKFALKDVIVSSANIVGEKHISLYVKNPLGGSGIKAICFKCVGTPLGNILLNSVGGHAISMSGKARLDTWNGAEKVQFLIDDVAF